MNECRKKTVYMYMITYAKGMITRSILLARKKGSVQCLVCCEENGGDEGKGSGRKKQKVGLRAVGVRQQKRRKKRNLGARKAKIKFHQQRISKHLPQTRTPAACS